MTALRNILKPLPAAAASLVILSAAGLSYAFMQDGSQTARSLARFTADNRLEFPSNYREWIYLSSGRGMTYGPAANPNGPPLFDNVFVEPSAYREFLKSGHWPDSAVFVLEVRDAVSEGSINRGGQFQKDIEAIEVEVKDQRFTDTDGWAYFQFDAAHKPATPLAKTAGCYACHSANGAVEHTFVQFYPTLIDFATAHHTMKPGNNASR
ncbi:MAG TPA: cytochrome P460 family protein [Bryobacteraceae bacterium]|nr:cytochrome P460 family protein [Bryobacteraceae bacterium]